MKVRSIRRIVADSNHLMCTGAAFFKGALFIAYRQGDAHVSDNGKLNVIRSRDEGKLFEHVATLRGANDTRDPHLYRVGEERLIVTGFEAAPINVNGMSYTEDGLTWSPWRRYTGCEGWWMWHPEHYRGRHYCVGYIAWNGKYAIAWFESDNGIDWKQIQTLREGPEEPSETNLLFKDDGTALILVRRDSDTVGQRPLLMWAGPPYRQWEVVEIPLHIVGLAMWMAGGDLYFSGRWFLHFDVAHQGVFRLEDADPRATPELRMVLPGGPHFDFSYMGVARHPDNPLRFFLSYYSNHTAPDDPNVDQWSHPDIYLVDAVFHGEFIPQWRVSDVVPGSLAQATPPDPAEPGLNWRTLRPGPHGRWDHGFVDTHEISAGRAGLIWFVTDLDVGPTDAGVLYLGYDGPIKVWVNNRPVFEGVGTNPAELDQTTIPVRFHHGVNRVAIALDTNGGKAWGIFARYEKRAAT